MGPKILQNRPFFVQTSPKYRPIAQSRIPTIPPAPHHPAPQTTPKNFKNRPKLPIFTISPVSPPIFRPCRQSPVAVASRPLPPKTPHNPNTVAFQRIFKFLSINIKKRFRPLADVSIYSSLLWQLVHLSYRAPKTVLQTIPLASVDELLFCREKYF